MKHILLVVALLVPGLAVAYPNPNITAGLTAGDLVDTVLTQPMPAPIVLADNALLPPSGQ